MALYNEELLSAFEDIKEAGGKIWFRSDEKTEPKDPSLPWQGSDEEVDDEIEHVAAFFPLSENVSTIDTNPFAESCLIPAYGLDFEVKEGTIFRKEDGAVLVVSNVIPLRPNGVQTIIYICEVNTWPGT